eukprot:gnl/MRDRNA2_/MRDRNA2_43698_c0_seq1.p1 gnl/MRDRNA2_/MRDRNA2_43698_c0~~gnl/MRDRNA2_/MRDRNA2_43698_c0_seq1.p1  ORF type:complete len:182 (-),score=2.21 gnl/MRDRNA2_/MRDRNA2_43698_c0_seq1:70-615(-)
MRTIVLVISLLVLVGCKSTDPAITEAEAQRTKTLIDSKNYELDMSWATPLASNAMNQISNANLLPADSRTGRINLMGSSSYIRVKGDSLEVYLPYFGTHQIGHRPGDTNSAIQFVGEPDKYEASYNEKKELTQIYFRMKERTEQYDVNIRVFNNGNANVNVNSTHRNSISYTGKLKEIEEK